MSSLSDIINQLIGNGDTSSESSGSDLTPIGSAAANTSLQDMINNAINGSGDASNLTNEDLNRMLNDQINQSQQNAGMTPPTYEQLTAPGGGSNGEDLTTQLGGTVSNTPMTASGSNPIQELLKSLSSGVSSLNSGIAGMKGNSLLSALPGILGAYAANNQTKAYTNLANQYMGMGQPYRDQLSSLMANPSSFLSSDQVKIPVQQGTDALMRSLSTQGNPWGQGNALQQGQQYATNSLYSQLQSKQNQLGQLGGLASFSSAAPAAQNGAIASNANTANALGNSVSSIFNPPQTLAQQLQGLGSLFGKAA